MRYSIECKLKC